MHMANLTMGDPSGMLMVVCKHPSSKWRLWDWDSSQNVSMMLVFLIEVGSINVHHCITSCLRRSDSN